MRLNSATVSNVAFTLACLMFIALGGLRLKEGLTKSATPPGRQPSAVQDIEGVDVSISDAEIQGDATATVVLIEFSDFQCPFCGRYAKDTYETLKEEFVDSGKVKYAFMDFPLEMHPLAEKASEAAACAGAQGHFWDMHKRLFNSQDSLTPTDLARHAMTLGLRSDEFRSCLRGAMTNKVRHNVDEGKRIGVTSTPTFLIGHRQQNGTVRIAKQILGAQPLDVFRANLRATLQAAPMGG